MPACGFAEPSVTSAALLAMSASGDLSCTYSTVPLSIGDVREQVEQEHLAVEEVLTDTGLHALVVGRTRHRTSEPVVVSVTARKSMPSKLRSARRRGRRRSSQARYSSVSVNRCAEAAGVLRRRRCRGQRGRRAKRSRPLLDLLGADLRSRGSAAMRASIASSALRFSVIGRLLVVGVVALVGGGGFVDGTKLALDLGAGLEVLPHDVDGGGHCCPFRAEYTREGALVCRWRCEARPGRRSTASWRSCPSDDGGVPASA